MAKDGMVSISIENTDLSATLTEYAQENANLRPKPAPLAAT